AALPARAGHRPAPGHQRQPRPRPRRLRARARTARRGSRAGHGRTRPDRRGHRRRRGTGPARRGAPAGARAAGRLRRPRRAAGLTAARELVEDGASVLDDDALLDLANRIEGHPDNVAPALRGGLTIAWLEQDPEHVAGLEQGTAEARPSKDRQGTDPVSTAAGSTDRQPEHTRAFALRLDPSPDLAAVAFIPPNPLATEVARGLLPARVTHRDAAFNAGRA